MKKPNELISYLKAQKVRKSYRWNAAGEEDRLLTEFHTRFIDDTLAEDIDSILQDWLQPLSEHEGVEVEDAVAQFHYAYTQGMSRIDLAEMLLEILKDLTYESI